MPGPGGGSRGGGFSSGSRGGGSYGGYGGGYHRPYGGFFFFPWRRPYYGYGGGFFGGLFGLFFLPIIILVLAGIFLVTSIVSLIAAVASGGVVQYNEYKFQAYADEQYSAIYGEYEDAYEDNIVIIFTTSESFDEYYSIAWVGDNISTNINLMFGDETTEFGYAMERCILVEDGGYKSSLSKNLAMAVDLMKDSCSGYNSFVKNNSAERGPSVVINRDEDLNFNEQTVKNALDAFTEETGIPISIVIEDAEDVFGKTIPPSYIIMGLISLAICIFAGVWIYKSAKAKKQAARADENRRNGTDYNDPRYWN